MRPSALFVLLSIFTSLVGASKGTKGHQAVGIYYAYSLEWLAQNKDPTYVRALAAPCYGKGDCSTFAKFLETVLPVTQYERAKETGIFDSGGPLDNSNPGDEAAKAFNTNPVLNGKFDNVKMYGPGTPSEEKYSLLTTRIGNTVDRARISLGSEGQDIVDKIAQQFIEVVKARKEELSPDKITSTKKSNPNINFKTMADNPNEIDWKATFDANPDLQTNGKKRREIVRFYKDFDGKTLPTHVAAIEAATSLVNRLRSPPCG